MRGPGVITRTNAISPPGGGGITNGLRNGLSIVGGWGELGGANPLLHLSNIEQAGFPFRHSNGGNVILSLDPTSNAYAIGDLSNAINGTLLNVNDASQFVAVQNGGADFLLIDVLNSIYRIGDISSVGNDTRIDVKDGSQAIELDAGLSPSRFTLAGTPAAESAIISMGGANYFILDLATQFFGMGDFSGGFNQTNFLITDAVSRATVSSAGFTMLVLDMGSGVFQLGSSAGGTANLTYWEVNDSTQIISAFSGGFQDGMFLDMASQIYQIGEVAGNFNSTNLLIIDSNRSVNISSFGLGMLNLDGLNDSYTIGNASGATAYTTWGATPNKIFMNASAGVGINQPTTLSPFAVAALQNFATNAAAIAAGLGVGDFYRLSAAGTSAVMVVE